MAETEISKLAGSLLPFGEPKKAEFITRHLDPGYFKRKDAKLQEFNRACASLGTNLLRVNSTIEQLGTASRTKEDFDMCASLRTRVGKVMSSLGEKTKSADKALQMVVEADRALMPIAADAQKYVNTLAQGGRDLGSEAQIEGERLKAKSRQLELEGAFGLAFNDVALRVLAAAPKDPFNPEAAKTFKEEFRGYSSEINLVRSNDPEMTVEKARGTFAGIITRMEETARTQTSALNLYDRSPEFVTYLADAKLKGQIEVELKLVDGWLDILNRWETAAQDPIREEKVRIEGALETAFVVRKGMDPSAIKTLEEQQKKLLADVTALKLRAGNVANAEAELFEQERQALVRRLNGLESRATTALKKMDSKQRPAVLDTLATANLAITGLNGCNYDALKTGTGLLDTLETMVVDAENIKVINEGIKTTLKEATRICGTMKKDTNPKSAKSIELATEIAEYEKIWLTKVVNEAKAEAEALKARADALSTENAAILLERTEIAKIILVGDQHFAQLDLAFKAMAKGSSAEGRDYAGTLKGDLDTCKSWNASKTELSFYSTIRAKLKATIVAMDKMIKDMEAISKLSPNEVLLQGLEADRAFREKVEKIRSDAEKNGKAPDANALAAAKAEYDERMNGLNLRADLLGESNGQVAAQEKDAQDKEKFLLESKALIEEIKKDQKAAGKKDAINAYDDEVQRHIDRLETTQDMIKKKDPGMSGAAAMSELALIRGAIVSIKKRGEKTSKSDLGAIKGQWDKAVGVFIGEVNGLMTAIDTFETEQGATTAAGPTIRKVLNKVISCMNGNGFLQPALDLSRDDATDAERKSAREAALAEVRRLRKAVLEDPVVQKCVLNPFGKPLGNAVQYRLEEIELNVLRGV